MINKKYMNYIRKELKKENSIIIKYFPNEKEKEYLSKFNINIEKVIITTKGLLSNSYYEVEYCKYYLK